MKWENSNFNLHWCRCSSKSWHHFKSTPRPTRPPPQPTRRRRTRRRRASRRPPTMSHPVHAYGPQALEQVELGEVQQDARDELRDEQQDAHDELQEVQRDQLRDELRDEFREEQQEELQERQQEELQERQHFDTKTHPKHLKGRWECVENLKFMNGYTKDWRQGKYLAGQCSSKMQIAFDLLLDIRYMMPAAFPTKYDLTWNADKLPPAPTPSS